MFCLFLLFSAFSCLFLLFLRFAALDGHKIRRTKTQLPPTSGKVDRSNQKNIFTSDHKTISRKLGERPHPQTNPRQTHENARKGMKRQEKAGKGLVIFGHSSDCG